MKEASKQTAKYVGDEPNFSLKVAGANVIFAITIDALASRLLNGQKGVDFKKEIKAYIERKAGGAIKSYMLNVVVNAAPGVIAEALKSIPDVLNGSKEVSAGSGAQSVGNSLLAQAGADVLGPVAERLLKPISDEVLIRICDAAVSKVAVPGAKITSGKLFLDRITDKHAKAGIKSLASTLAKNGVRVTLDKWKTTDTHKNFEAEVIKLIAGDKKFIDAMKQAAKSII